jgi:hypothetical protein
LRRLRDHSKSALLRLTHDGFCGPALPSSTIPMARKAEAVAGEDPAQRTTVRKSLEEVNLGGGQLR